MATQESARPFAPSLPSGKRKFLSDSSEPFPKKRRAEGARIETLAPSRSQTSASSTPSHYSQVYDPLVSRLLPKHDVKTMSVMPSTSISKHVDRALDHMSRFSPWDPALLPGVVLLCAKSPAAGKLVTISELVRRRIGESEQKWFQYNVLREMVVEEPAPSLEEPSVVKDTFMATNPEDEEDEEEEYFETRRPTIHEQAVQPPKVRHQTYLSVLLSRVPLDALKTENHVSMQTNEQTIEYLRKKKLGLVA
ncbi:hypothetical protein C8A05DRAFT_40498 [Staphylotrichum tortipilum]|uniref:DNA/RNA-binding protein Alba-like domain-containing protein n=1 Tax=Staphylotrichum tortipilum TaxID=2831512 RepID=A0AAN6MTM2_9PEZI|nr:hypothetical protein C8A05DRAFT_40498 [Staphylotrichum longicolle]